MAVKPHESTVDTMIDQFDRFDVETQERVLDQLALVHRLAKRRKPEKPADPVDTVSISPEARAKLNGAAPPVAGLLDGMREDDLSRNRRTDDAVSKGYERYPEDDKPF